jgi:phosphoribosyl-ATP pyrophosphohydrolase
MAAGHEALVQKPGEEAIEVIVAALGQGDERLISEEPDLVYHLLVLLTARGMGLQAVETELGRRHAARK